MVKKTIPLIIVLAALAFAACEKDDICVEGDTPLLVIRFYDTENRTEFKGVPSLRVVGKGKSTTVDTFADRGTLDSIAIPLNAGETISEFLFIMDSADDEEGFETGNIDALNFNYEIQEKFLGRACGFIANYDSLDFTFPQDAENWIQNIEVAKALVKTEDTLSAHVKIFH
jgi:hypothetical protein